MTSEDDGYCQVLIEFRLGKLLQYHALTFETTLVLQMLMVSFALLMLAYKQVQQDVLLFTLIENS